MQYKEKGGFLHVIMQKKIPFHIWPSLKVSLGKQDILSPPRTRRDIRAEWSDVCMHFALNILEFCILLKKKT